MGGEIISDASNKRLATPRRIVTAADGDGRSRVASDGHALASLEIAGPGSTRFFNAWHTEPADRLPYSIGSADPAATFTDMSQIFPGPGGNSPHRIYMAAELPTRRHVADVDAQHRHGRLHHHHIWGDQLLF